MSTSQLKNEGQLSTGLPAITQHITGHNDQGRAIVRETRPGKWQSLLNDTLAFNVVYTTSEFPASLNDDKDIKTHDELIASQTLGLVNPKGTVCRMVDFAPGSEPLMHRTQSLDYGLVLEGEVEMLLDDGVSKVMKRGDVAVQRCTMHGWKNASKTEWCRMFFVLQECQELKVEGKELGEDLSAAGKAGDHLAAHGKDGDSKM